MKKKYYAIKAGKKSGIVVNTWTECALLVAGYKGAIYKGFGQHQKAEAEQFAKSGKKPASNYATPHWQCTLRKSYHDSFTGVLYKNRCVMRKGPTIRGEHFKPHIGNSCPF